MTTFTAHDKDIPNVPGVTPEQAATVLALIESRGEPDVPQPGADRTCTECGEPVDRDGLTTGECGGGGGQKCGECFACSCDGSC